MMPTTENITELSTHAIEHHEVFYKSAEFWVGASFVLVVALLYKPLISVIKSAIFSRIERIKNELQEAEELKLKAQELYAKYERNLLNIDDEIAHIADVAIKEGTITKTSDGMKFYKAFNDGVVSNKVENLLNKHLNTKNLNLKEKIELMDYLHDLHYLNSKILELPHDKIKELLDKNTIFALTSNSSHKHIYHELGHKIHSK